MKNYTVLYRDNTLLCFEPPLAFNCQADDGDHAEEQCVNAYPECDIVWVEEDCVSVKRALQNYFNDNIQ